MTKKIMEIVEKKFYQQILDIINSEDKYNVPEAIIHHIEDTDFSVEQSEVISPWLIGFALKNRDNHDSEDESTMFFSVSSAIRTGASMLYSDQVELLFPLLETGHPIDTSLVTVKMISRIFEAQPPSVLGEHKIVAEKMCEIADEILNGSSTKLSHVDVALIQLCITSLIGMGSKKVYQVLEQFENKEKWMKSYILHNIKDLEKVWQKRKDPISEPMNEFINETINFFEKE
jgi:regulator of RNase E activity RraB